MTKITEGDQVFLINSFNFIQISQAGNLISPVRKLGSGEQQRLLKILDGGFVSNTGIRNVNDSIVICSEKTCEDCE